MPEKLVDAIVNMQEKEALATAKKMAEEGDSIKVLEQCREAMETVGNRFEEGKFFLPELILAGEMLSQISEIVKPKLGVTPDSKRLGKVVLGTVEGDIHDIGKDIVSFMLDVNGFEVHDVGIDAPPAKFVKAIKDFQPEIVALSGFLTLAFDSMKATVEAISEAGLRDQVKIMIGGGQIDDIIREHSGADAYGTDAMAAVSLSKAWISGN